MLTVISHRRSGTHLTIDLIRNNFENFSSPYVSLDDLNKRDRLNFTKFCSRKNSMNRIFKSHTDTNYQLFYKNGNSSDLFSEFEDDSKVIYVYRNVFDCLTSLYFHYQKHCPKKVINQSVLSFFEEKNDYHNHEKINNISRYYYWAEHIVGWENVNCDILFISFEDLIQNYNSSVRRIAKYLNTEISEIHDVRINNENNLNIIRDNTKPVIGNQINYTTVNFRKGKIGDCKEHFDPSVMSKYKEKILNEYGTSTLLEKSFSKLNF